MSGVNIILGILHDKRGFDFSGYRLSMLNRRIQKRLYATKSASYIEYEEYLRQNDSELENLINVLTINVSRFFRNSFPFEFFSDQLLPKLISEKNESKDRSLRIWSTGCACGDEPYSMAILIREIL